MLSLLFALPALAQDPAPPPAAEAEAALHPLEGPAHVELGHDLAIDLPEGYVLLERADAVRFSESNGNFGNEDLLALVAPADGDWFVNIEFVADGYISDDDASELDADGLLQSYKEGTEASNEQRKAAGFDALTVDGWTDPPRYDAALHRLTWGLTGHDSDSTSVNHFTRILGRGGYASLDIIAAPEDLAVAKAGTDALLAATQFAPGARYEDFDPKTDRVAEYGMAALVLGGAGAVAAKSGLLAKLLAVLLAGKKFFVFAFLAVGAAVRKLFGGKAAPDASTPG